MTDANPFEDLHPVIRNEEDEIRKSVFSYALRRLHGLSSEEKIAWREAVREASAPRQSKKTALAAQPIANNSLPLSKEERVSELAADLQHHVSNIRNPVDVNTVDSETCPTIQREQSEGADRGPAAVLAEANKASTGTATPTGSPTPAEAAAASEYIGAYMRTQLDKVVGGSLNDLAVPALRVLCFMMGICTTARSKDALYSMLANFHFTRCARLGKRTRRDTFAKREVMMQTADILSKAAPPQKSKPRVARVSDATSGRRGQTPTPCRVTAGTTKMPTDELTKSMIALVHSSGGDRSTTEPVRQSRPAPPRAQRVQKANGECANTYADSDFDDDTDPAGSDDDGGRDELHVACNQPVFKPPASMTALPSGPPGRSTASAGSSWALPDLERKVASIVQLYDPVTVSIVVKKLSQMGYRDAEAADVVEGILRRFHKMQFVFYDNGIAYMM